MYERIWDWKPDVTLKEILDEMIRDGVTHEEYIPDWVFDNSGIKSNGFNAIVKYKGQEFVCYSQWSYVEMEEVNYIRKMKVIEL